MDDTLFAVKAPFGSTLEVPDPEEASVALRFLFEPGTCGGGEREREGK